jgi:hypothetical protein
MNDLRPIKDLYHCVFRECFNTNMFLSHRSKEGPRKDENSQWKMRMSLLADCGSFSLSTESDIFGPNFSGRKASTNSWRKKSRKIYLDVLTNLNSHTSLSLFMP